MQARPSTAKLMVMLFRHQIRRLRREFTTRSDRVILIVLSLLGAYLGFTLVVLGLKLPIFLTQISPGGDPLVAVHRQTIAGLIGLFGMRFLFEKSPRMLLEPLRHLPVRPFGIALFFAVFSAVSVHTLFPLLFLIPFAYAQIGPAHGVMAATIWLVGTWSLLLTSHLANLYLRTLLSSRERTFLLLLGASMLLVFADEYLGTYVIARTSAAIFGQLGAGDAWTLLSIVLLVPAAGSLALGALIESMRRDPAGLTPVRRIGRLHTLAERWDVAGHLVWLELRLMWRNRRPRHYLLISIMFSTVYLVLMLASRQMFGGLVFGAVIGLFASGGFALNYGQLMFGWDSSYYDGLMARAVRAQVLARTKLVVLQGSCLGLFVVSLPLFLWLRPDLVPLHVAFLFYNAGVTTQLVMELATRNSDFIDLGRSGGFFNYEGFSARHWLWFIPTALPPTLLIIALRNQPDLALTILGVAGLISLALTEVWSRRHAAAIARNKYRMSSGFRTRS